MTAPTAVGTLAETPLAHALIYARNRRLSGRLELVASAERRATITLWRGRIVGIAVVPASDCAAAYLGAILREQGRIDAPTLDTTLAEAMKTNRLHGEVLIERGIISVAHRDDALLEQVHRKVHHLFSWPAKTTYAFYDTRLEKNESFVAIDLLGPVWRGVRDYPPIRFVSETLRRVGESALRVADGACPRLPPDEMALTEALSRRPMTVAEMKAATTLPEAHVDLFVYLLVISKFVESVSGVRAHPSTGPLPVAMPSGPMTAFRTSSATKIPARIPTPSGVRAATAALRISMRPTTPPSSSKVPVGRPTASTTPPPSGTTSKTPPAPSVAPPPLLNPAELGAEGILARAALIEREDYFQVLGIAHNATAEAVRAAFVRLAKVWHPDRAPAELRGVQTDIAKIFSHMSRARQTLSDPEARRGYIATHQTKPKARSRAEVLREIEHATKRADVEFVLQLCQELIDTDADDAEAIARQAWASVRFGEATDEKELHAALSKLDRAVTVNRTDAHAVYHRGLMHKRLNNVPAAFRDFARALQLDPKHIDAEREVRLFAMRARKGSGEQTLAAPVLEKLGIKK